MAWPCGYGFQPVPHVSTEDIVLHHRAEARSAVFLSGQRSQAVAQVEQSARLGGTLVARVHPAANGPPVELPAPDVNSASEFAGQQLCHSGLASRLNARYQPDALSHCPPLSS